MKAIEELRKVLLEAQKSKEQSVKEDSKSAILEFRDLLAEVQKTSPIREENIGIDIPTTIEDITVPITEEDIASLTAKYLSQSKAPDPSTIEANRWNDPLRKEPDEKFVTTKEMREHYGLFLQRIQQQMSSLSGGGEVNFRNLDDVDSSTIGPNKHLAYNPTTRKFFFESVTASEPQVQSDWGAIDTDDVAFIKNKPENLSDFINDSGYITNADGGNADQLDGQEGAYYLDYSNFTNTPLSLEDDSTTTDIANNTISVINLPNAVVGPIQGIRFDTTHEHEGEEVGTLCWNQEDDTMNIQHSNGVVQQIGQELCAYVRNGTANTITNGTVVRFDGAEENGTSRLLVAPFLADGSFPSQYGIGIATSDIVPGDDGRVTVWGKVRDLDTSDWSVGDILYVSPSVPGGMTNIKPTAPDNVIVIAAVLRSDETTGEIFARPTIEQQQYYGRFARTTTQSANTINTAYPILFDDTEISNGVSIGTPSSRLVVSQSGFYQFDVSIQAVSTSNKGLVYLWFRKGDQNGSSDVPMSSRTHTVTNGDSFTITNTLQISLQAGEYVEVVWAASAAGISLSANTTPVVGPSIASALLSVAQIQL